MKHLIATRQVNKPVREGRSAAGSESCIVASNGCMKRRQRLLKEYELASKVNLMSKPYCFNSMGQHQSRINDKWQRFDRGLEVFQRQMWLHGNTGEPIVSAKNTVKEDWPYQKNPIPDGNYLLHLRS